MTWVRHIQMSWVSVHCLHLLPYCVSVVREIDTVTKTLTHLLLTICTRQTTCRSVLWQHNSRLNEYWCINLIEATYEFTCQLQHRLLVLTCRDSSSLKSCNISSLRNRISKEAHWDISFKVAHLNLSLHRWVTLNTAYADKIHQESGQFSYFRNLTLYVECTFLWTQASREII